MSKTILIKLTRASSKAGPFNIKDQFGRIIKSNVSKDTLISGVVYSVEDDVVSINLESIGDCKISKTNRIGDTYPSAWNNVQFSQTHTACMWRHLTNVEICNTFYGKLEPYIIEYPFAAQYQDEILQNVVDYSKVYKYLSDGTGVFDDSSKVELDDVWFNKAVIYNGQQSSGLLELVPKPKNNLKEYMKYPIIKTDSKVITFTKSDNFYQYNTFWSIVKNKSVPLFTTTCESLSVDKVVNQSNMDYSSRSFTKDTIRAKELKIRHILDNRSDVHVVSQFIIAPSQISYK